MSGIKSTDQKLVESQQDIQTSEATPPKSCTCCNKVCNAALKALEFLGNVLYHAILIIVKAVVIPIELSLTAVVASITALSILISLPFINCKTTPFTHSRALLNEFLDLINVTFFYGIHPYSERLQKADDKKESPLFAVVGNHTDKIPVLYAPGYLDDPGTLRPLCREIAQRYGGVVYIVQYRSKFQSIDENAKDVARVADRIVKDTGDERLIAGGHSMGGLVTGRFIQMHVKRDIALWFTDASPLKGTIMANLGIGPNATDMLRGSEIVGNLNEPSRLNGIRSIHIHTHTDLVVIPTRSEYRQEQHNGLVTNVDCTGYGHLSARTCEKAISEKIKVMNEVNDNWIV